MIEASEPALEPASDAASQPDARRARTWRRVEFTNATGGQPLRDRVEVVASLADERVKPRFDAQSGEFEFVGLRSGLWRLQARAHGYQDFATDVVIYEREATGDRFKTRRRWRPAASARKFWRESRTPERGRRDRGHVARIAPLD